MSAQVQYNGLYARTQPDKLHTPTSIWGKHIRINREKPEQTPPSIPLPLRSAEVLFRTNQRLLKLVCQGKRDFHH
jgi:hypothetical protein